MSRLVAGIFVGGAGQRMGGRAKGLLPAPSGETIVARWCELFAKVAADVVLVGEGDAYAALGLPRLSDDPPGVGPMGGLSALLAHARGGTAIAVACDMPYVSAGLLLRLRDAPPARVVAPRRDQRWEPLFARYDADAVHPVALSLLELGRHALQALLDEAGAAELILSPTEALELSDWDAPEDLPP